MSSCFTCGEKKKSLEGLFQGNLLQTECSPLASLSNANRVESCFIVHLAYKVS